MLYLLIMAFLQIVIESFPVSSSGNCALWVRILERFTNIKTMMITTDVDFLLHGPTILVVVLSFFDTLRWYIVHRADCWSQLFQFFTACCIADIITLAGYVLFRHYRLVTIPVWFGFLLTAGLLISLPLCKQDNEKKSITYRDAAVIGSVQAVALLPGISRLASTYAAGCWLGYSPFHALGYSLAFQFPLLCAAFFKGCCSIIGNPALYAIFSWQLIAVSSVAGLVAYYGFQYVKLCAVNRTLHYMAWYVFATTWLAYLYGI